MMSRKYDDSFPKKAGIYAKAGDHDGEIADQLGICPATFYNYKRQYPEFAEALESGRAMPEMQVEDSLLELAMGLCYVTTVVQYPDGKEVKTVRQRPPDVRAMIHWLEKNKQYGEDYIQEPGCHGRQPSEEEPYSNDYALPEPEPVWRPDPEEELKAKALAEYHALPGFRPDPDFSKKDKAEFDSLISITLAEVEKRKQQAAGIQPVTASAAAAPASAGNIPEGLPTMYALPQNFSKMSKKDRRRMMSNPKASMEKIEWSPEVIEAWKALAEDFERL